MIIPSDPRLTLVPLAPLREGEENPLDSELLNGLQQQPKRIPCRYFYNDRGSELFEQICTLPEYYPTRTETAILHSGASQIAQRTGPCEVVELGSGSSTKTRLLLDAYTALDPNFTYIPIDVSGGMLRQSAGHLLADYAQLQVQGLVGTYHQGLQYLGCHHNHRRLICFLGSSLGNFEPAECDRFFQEIHHALQPGDYFLLGVDLVKDPAILEAAYNDRQGITAAFNLNVLDHLNERFGGNLRPECFRHRAIYNSHDQQIEMYLDCIDTHQAHLAALATTLSFDAGESLFTEISRKFTLSQLQSQVTAHRLMPLQHWCDPQEWFALLLTQVQGETPHP